MSDAELLAAKIRERLHNELDSYFQCRVVAARAQLSQLLSCPLPPGARTLDDAICGVVDAYITTRTDEYLPTAMQDVLKKVTFNVLTEDGDDETPDKAA